MHSCRSWDAEMFESLGYISEVTRHFLPLSYRRVSWFWWFYRYSNSLKLPRECRVAWGVIRLCTPLAIRLPFEWFYVIL